MLTGVVQQNSSRPVEWPLDMESFDRVRLPPQLAQDDNFCHGTWDFES